MSNPSTRVHLDARLVPAIEHHRAGGSQSLEEIPRLRRTSWAEQ
jgi:hypothetical protein